MTGESQSVAALKRAGARAVFHLLRAGVESLRAIEAVVEELGRVRQATEPADETERPVRIEIE